MASTSDRGYGSEHRSIRRALLDAPYGQPCHHCGMPMLSGQALDFDHTVGPTAASPTRTATAAKVRSAVIGSAVDRARCPRLRTGERQKRI